MALRPIYHVGIIAVTLALAACSSAAPPRGERPGSPTVGAQFGHIHAVDLNPTDGSVFAATHHGVFRIDPRGGPVQVIGRAQDMRGFTVTDDDRILSSGHPDSPEAGPTDLGLIVSNDGARTWTPVSLSGEADFHSLSAAGATVYGFDVVTGSVMRSDDNGQHWQRGAKLDATRVDVDPTDPYESLQPPGTASGRAPTAGSPSTCSNRSPRGGSSWSTTSPTRSAPTAFPLSSGWMPRAGCGR